MTLTSPPPGRHLAGPAPARSGPPLRGARLVETWTLTVAAGEAIGFLVPAATGAASVDLSATVAVPLLLAAGAVEGAVLGWVQARVLRRALPGLDRGRWIVLTSAAAVVAYVLSLVMTSAGSADHGWPTTALATASGLLLLLSLGGAQWLELRRHVPSAAPWILWTAVGWLAALGTFLAIATPLWHEGQATATVVAIGAGAGVVMATVQAAVTGWGLDRILVRADDKKGWPR